MENKLFENTNEYHKWFMANYELSPEDAALLLIQNIKNNGDKVEYLTKYLVDRVNQYDKNSKLFYEWHGQNLDKIKDLKLKNLQLKNQILTQKNLRLEAEAKLK